jgi:hypothetical protein
VVSTTDRWHCRRGLTQLPEALADRWPYILEDEAQDSSRLQEQILRLLTGEVGNWVRVGDPNQAIFETFTTASPEYLRNFLTEPGVQPRELPDSGRSSLQIIDLANYLIDWTQTQHPREAARGALTPPTIHPVPPGDQQPNPPAGKVHFHLPTHPTGRIQVVADSWPNGCLTMRRDGSGTGAAQPARFS